MGSLFLATKQQRCSNSSFWPVVWLTPLLKLMLRLTHTITMDTLAWDSGLTWDTLDWDTPHWDTLLSFLATGLDWDTPDLDTAEVFMVSVRLRLNLRPSMVTTIWATATLDTLVLHLPSLLLPLLPIPMLLLLLPPMPMLLLLLLPMRMLLLLFQQVLPSVDMEPQPPLVRTFPMVMLPLEAMLLTLLVLYMLLRGLLMLMLSLRPIPTTTMDTMGWVTTVLDTLALAAWDTDPTVPWDTGTSDTGPLDTGTTDTLDRQKILPNCLTGSLIVPKNYKILLDAFRYPFRILRK